MNRLRAVHAVFCKQFIQTMRYPTWIIQLIIWPLIFPLVYILSAMSMGGTDKSGFRSFEAVTGTSNYAGFIIIGTMAWMWVNIIMWDYGTFLRDEQTRGTLESNWLCPINKIDILIGGGIMPFLMSIMVNIVSMAEYRLIYGIHFKGSILEWALLFIVMIPAVYGFGMLFASLILWAKEANAAVNVARGAMMILCGITFPITIMPEWMQFLAKGLPFTYGIAACRQVMINGEGMGNAGYNIGMCLLEGSILIALGVFAFKCTEKKVKNSGSLERF